MKTGVLCGEFAVDTGGPAREFWRLLTVGMEQHYCRSGEDGCCFFLTGMFQLYRYFTEKLHYGRSLMPLP